MTSKAILRRRHELAEAEIRRLRASLLVAGWLEGLGWGPDGVAALVLAGAQLAARNAQLAADVQALTGIVTELTKD